VNNSWQDQDAAWWAKAHRARHHIDAVRELVAAYNPATAYEIVAEPAAASAPGVGVTDLRLKELRKPPTELLTTIGDVLHNLRSCLDSVAFELAQRSSGGAMSPKQEKAIYFPICEDSDAFEDFLGHKHRAGVFGEHEVKALRCAQPFALREEFAKHGVSLPTTEAEEYKINELARLERLNNLDKHRYLPMLGWHFSIAYGIKDGPIPNRCRLQRLVAFSDGDVIGQAMWSGPGPDPVGNLKIEMDLTLAEDPGYATGLMDALNGWHQYVAGWIVPRIFIVADGNQPPIMIG
jgi:hypothetical protein